MKVSLVVLTYNRNEIVQKALDYSLSNTGDKIDELIWVDNGSSDGVRDYMKSLNPDVSIINSTNLGVSKGYNRGMILATGDYISIIGCDRLMPENWLATFKRYFRAIPSAHSFCMVQKKRDEEWTQWKKEITILNGLPVRKIGCGEARLFRRDLLHKIGYFREDFGLYGWEDVEWSERLKQQGFEGYQIPYLYPEHLGVEGINNLEEDADNYTKFKHHEARHPDKEKKWREIERQSFPFYSPY